MSREVRDVFDARAPSYDYYDGARGDRPIDREKTSRLRSALRLGNWRSVDHVTSVGCGPAPLLAVLDNWRGVDAELVGFDLSPRMVDRARERVPRASVDQSDAADLPLSDDSTDAIAALGLVGYLDSLDRALREWERVLSPGGQLVLSWPNDGLSRRIRQAYKRSRRLGKRVTGLGSLTPYNLSIYSETELREALNDHGFRCESDPEYLTFVPDLSGSPTEARVSEYLDARLSSRRRGRVAMTGVLAATYLPDRLDSS